MIEWLLTSRWSCEASSGSWFSSAYRALNLVEGSIWVALALVVLLRHLRNRKTWLELPYAAAFATFGASDFREAVDLQNWLILAKAVNLAVLLGLRNRVLRHYPGRRTF